MILAERYQVIRPLAQGRFGKTFLACDRYLPGQPHCVIKQFLPLDITADALQTAQRLFNLEAETLYKLGTHPQIPTLLAHFEQAGEFYLVQAYISGETMAEELRSLQIYGQIYGQTSVCEQNPSHEHYSSHEHYPSHEHYTFSLLQDLLSVLAFVHQNGVIHRDVKPENIIRHSQTQRLVLIDFGAVKTMVTALSKDGAAHTISIGSRGYIAPEQQAGRPCFASDLYAVGMIGLQAITGKSLSAQPMDPATGRIRLEAATETATEAGSANYQLIAFIAQLIQPHPGDRFTDAEIALSALQSLAPLLSRSLSSRPLSSRSTSSQPQPLTNFVPTALPPQTPLSQISSSRPSSSRPSSSRPSSSRPSSSRPSSQVLPPQPLPKAALAAPYTAPYTASQTAYSSTAARNQQALINKVHRFWIQGVLEQSLHGQVLLTLGLEERQQALALPWNISWKTDTQPVQPLAAGTSVFDIFQRLGEGRSLLILGEPGAGKTTTLLTLARDLLAQRSTRRPIQPTVQPVSQQRIPAIFNLSSWTGGPIEQWLVSELNSKYQIPKAIGQAWVKEQQMLLLLDGLDEVRRDLQSDCGAALNQFYRDYGPELVVCCRANDYEALDQKLAFQSAVYVRSLTDEQIWHYLDQAETGLTGLRSLLKKSRQNSDLQPVDVQANKSGQDLFELARSPLILNIMVLTYQGISASQIPALSPGKSYTHQLFSAYVERMFQRRDMASPYSKQQTVRWLRSLAINLHQTSQTVFLIERMQVNWLTSNAQRTAYVALVIGCFLSLSTLVGWHVVSRQALPLALLVGGAICAKIFGLYRIVPAETLRWSWQKASRALLLGITLGPLIGWALKVIFVFTFSRSYCLTTPNCFRDISLIELSFGAVLGITYGLIRGLSDARIAIVTQPNQGIRQSAKNAIIFAVVATIASLTASLAFKGSTSPDFWAAAGLSFGLATGGGEACVKHGVLRFVLFCQGRIPWNYARFLDDAAQRIFLQKVGGGYIFVHRLLLEHFASLPNMK